LPWLGIETTGDCVQILYTVSIVRDDSSVV